METGKGNCSEEVMSSSEQKIAKKFDAAKFVRGSVKGAWAKLASKAEYVLMIRDR